MAEPSSPARRLDPKVRTLWRASLALSFLAPLGVGVAVVAANDLPFWTVLALPALLGAVAWVAPAINYERWRYEIRERDVFTSKGVVFFTQAVVPFDRIQLVKTQQGPLDRSLGLMQLVVTTAAGNEKIPGLTVAEAESLREELARVSGTLSV